MEIEHNLKIIETVLEFDLDGFYFGDDYGQKTALIMSHEMWRKFIKPGLAKMFDRVRQAEKVVLHSCGNPRGPDRHRFGCIPDFTTENL